MKKLHIKTTINTAFAQSYSNTNGPFYDSGNGKALPLLEDAQRGIASNIKWLQRQSDYITVVYSVYSAFVEKMGTAEVVVTVDAVAASIMENIIKVYPHLTPEHFSTTTYTKNKMSIRFGALVVTLEITKS